MGWNFVSDTFSKRMEYFINKEEAIKYCEMMGINYNIGFDYML